MNPNVTAFYHEPTGSIAYVAAEPEARRCAIVDSVLDFEPNAGRTSTEHADRIADFVERQGLEVVWHLETHAHADHFSAASHLKERLGGRIAIGAKVTEVQALWKAIYHFGPECRTDGSQFDHLFEDGERFRVGDLEGYVMDTPGHTPANVVYVIGDAAFVNDTILMPDFGTARADFPGGSARALYRSMQRILALPDDTRLFVGHDYGTESRDPAWETTVAEEKAQNIHLKDGTGEEAFVALREGRDRTLPMPRLILHSLQINIYAGRLPEPEANGTRYLKIPLNRL